MSAAAKGAPMTEATFYLVLAVFLAAGIVIPALAYRYWRLKSHMTQLAFERFEAWRRIEVDAIRAQQLDIARREAQVYFQQWKAVTEQQIRQDAIQRSQSATLGRITEHFIPYLAGFPYNPKDARFLGTPIDFVVFDGLSEGEVESVVFVEVKAGKGALSSRERRVRDAVREGRVRWLELRSDLLVAAPEAPGRDGASNGAVPPS
jgi:predicted Holliday junction resolvase-like endonuclease